MMGLSRIDDGTRSRVYANQSSLRTWRQWLWLNEREENDLLPQHIASHVHWFHLSEIGLELIMLYTFFKGTIFNIKLSSNYKNH